MKKRNLAPEHLETFAHVKRGLWQSTERIWKQNRFSEVSQSAVSNRLQKLRAEKLVECKRVGKSKHWRRA